MGLIIFYLICAIVLLLFIYDELGEVHEKIAQLVKGMEELLWKKQNAKTEPCDLQESDPASKRVRVSEG